MQGVLSTIYYGWICAYKALLAPGGNDDLGVRTLFWSRRSKVSG